MRYCVDCGEAFRGRGRATRCAKHTKEHDEREKAELEESLRIKHRALGNPLAGRVTGRKK